MQAQPTQPVSRRLERTSTPGIFKRGGRFVVIYRDATGRQKKRAARTIAEAKILKATLTADLARGEYRETSRVGFADYATSWISTYQGRTSRGVGEGTREDYRRALGLNEEGQPTGAGAVAFFGRMRVSAIEPSGRARVRRPARRPRSRAEFHSKEHRPATRTVGDRARGRNRANKSGPGPAYYGQLERGPRRYSQGALREGACPGARETARRVAVLLRVPRPDRSSNRRGDRAALGGCRRLVAARDAPLLPRRRRSPEGTQEARRPSQPRARTGALDAPQGEARGER